MWSAIRRAMGLDRRRAFDSAGGGRRWEQAKTVDSLNAAILAGATVAARRAGYYARNNPWIAAAVQSLVANAVGTGIKPRSTHPNAKVPDALHALWARWTDQADATGLTDFYGLMTDVAQLEAWRDALLRARYAGVRTVECDDRRVSHATDAEMATALADLERRINAGRAERVTQVRMNSTKGV